MTINLIHAIELNNISKVKELIERGYYLELDYWWSLDDWAAKYNVVFLKDKTNKQKDQGLLSNAQIRFYNFLIRIFK